jgi:hypothetical protein
VFGGGEVGEVTKSDGEGPHTKLFGEGPPKKVFSVETILMKSLKMVAKPLM